MFIKEKYGVKLCNVIHCPYAKRNLCIEMAIQKFGLNNHGWQSYVFMSPNFNQSTVYG